MRKIIISLLLFGIAVVGLAGCQQDDGDVSALGTDGSTVAMTTATTQPDAEPDTTESGQTPNADGTANAEDTSANETVNPGVRGPIVILGNGEFTAQNGVVGGSGTAADPYVIAGWEITVPDGEYYGVRIENVTDSFVLRGLIIQNASEYGGSGIRVAFASSGEISGCSITNSMHGIELVSSTDLLIEDCVLFVSGLGLRVTGEIEEQYRHEIGTSNLFNGVPIYYYYGLDGETISDLETGHLTVAGSRNMTISNNEITNGDGLQLAFVEDSLVSLNVAHRLANVPTEHGIYLYESKNNELTNNLVKNNRLAGIQLTLSSGNKLFQNFSYANDVGIRAVASDDNSFIGNDLFGNVTGIALLAGATGNTISKSTLRDTSERMAQGILLENAFSNRIDTTLIYGSEVGIVLDTQAALNVVSGNTIVSGAYGLYLSGKNNTVERNLVAQQSRGILFPETFERTTTSGNEFIGNVLADNEINHIYTNMDSTSNVFWENVFLASGSNAVSDQGNENRWTQDGVGNFWGFSSVPDANFDGIGDHPITVYPAGIDDVAPLATINPRSIGLGILGTMDLATTSIETEDGSVIQLATYVADEPYERQAGFRGFPSELSTGFPGILFIFDEEVETNFTMQTVAIDLDIVFFNGDGEWAGSTTMSAQDTALYTSGSPFQYALELPSGTLEELGITSSATLVLP